MDDSIDPSRASYDRFAAAFAQRYYHTRALDADMDRFLACLSPPARVLDAGCGPGHQAAYFARAGHSAVGLDYSVAMLREGLVRGCEASLVSGDLTALPFPDRAFEGVWARASLIHLPHGAVHAALGEIRRVLGPDGILYTALRSGRGDTVRREVQNGVELARYFRFWDAGEWTDLLDRFGFVTLQSDIEPGEPEDWIWTISRAP